MFYPKLASGGRKSRVFTGFLGLDRRVKPREGAFCRMENLDSRSHPALSPRPPRGHLTTLQSPRGILGKEALAWVDGTKLFWNGLEVPGLVLEQEGEKTLVSMGAYIVIFPDKQYVNTGNLEEYGTLEQNNAIICTEESGVTCRLCLAGGARCDDYTVSDTPPAAPVSGALWLDTSGPEQVLKVYSADTELWAEVSNTFVRLEAPGIGAGLSALDGVTISGASAERFNGATVLEEAGEDYILIPGLLERSFVQTSGTLTVSRSVPDMDYVTQCGNRLWGCKYGLSGGRVVNEIYACALGDFKNWNRFQGLATDSYVASRGTDGPWTGAVTHLGCPVFFKENAIEKVYPSSAGAHEIVTTNCRGVEQGSEKSLALVGELLYYKSGADVCCYDGSLPRSVSETLGQLSGKNAVAGALGSRYYLSLEEPEGRSLLVCDTEKGLWHREDDPAPMGFATVGTELYALCPDGRLLAMTGSQGTLEGRVVWMARTGPMGWELESGSISRLTLQVDPEAGSDLDVYVRYDGGPWEHCANLRGQGLGRHLLRLLPHRCQHFALELRGRGACRVLSLGMVLEEGSESL